MFFYDGMLVVALGLPIMLAGASPRPTTRCASAMRTQASALRSALVMALVIS